VQRADPVDDEHQLLHLLLADGRLLDDLGVLDDGLELGEAAVEQAKLVEGVLR
jgi:hypothetical protein